MGQLNALENNLFLECSNNLIFGDRLRITVKTFQNSHDLDLFVHINFEIQNNPFCDVWLIVVKV